MTTIRRGKVTYEISRTNTGNGGEATHEIEVYGPPESMPPLLPPGAVIRFDPKSRPWKVIVPEFCHEGPGGYEYVYLVKQAD